MDRFRDLPDNEVRPVPAAFLRSVANALGDGIEDHIETCPLAAEMQALRLEVAHLREELRTMRRSAAAHHPDDVMLARGRPRIVRHD